MVDTIAAFRAKAPVFVRRFMADLSVGGDDAAASGNFAHESKGLTDLTHLYETNRGPASARQH